MEMETLNLVRSDRTAILKNIEQRVLWLAIKQVHYANREREKKDNLKVGGHQTSSASVVTIMTTLYFCYMRVGDVISIKPHASPVFHAIQYLLGNLDLTQLKQLREFGGLQAYPSRTKDPDGVEISTGSVGLGAVATNFAALTNAYLRTHGLTTDEPRRFISVLGDAELDEGSVWEAIAEPAMAGVDNILWIVDLNRQSLDRIIPGIRVHCWREMFAANGWEVINAKYGERLQAAFEQPNGELLRICIDELSNEAYQRLLRLLPSDLREWLPRKSSHPKDIHRLLDRWDDGELHDLFWNLGGHDVQTMSTALAHAAQTRGPSVIFAYTLKGWRLPSVGHPQNHAVLLSASQMETLRTDLGIAADDPWPRFDPQSPEGELCHGARAGLVRKQTSEMPRRGLTIPDELTIKKNVGSRSTQQAFGAILNSIARECPELARRVVTMSPDVASSTNLGGWITKQHVWGRDDQEPLPVNSQEGILHWGLSSHGQHLELGISENNLFMTLGQFGLSKELFGETLFPIGTLYDPFIRRGLDAFFYSAYSGAKFIVVGTPSGITLAPEGGAHQSLMTSSIGVELPELEAYEPCFAQELEWIMMDAIARIDRRESSTYLRLTTKPVDQLLFPSPASVDEREQLRRHILSGAYRLRDAPSASGYDPARNGVHLFACGAMVPEALAAVEQLKEEGIFANLFNVTGPGPLYRSFQRAVYEASEAETGTANLLDELIPLDERSAPVVTVVDAHPHSLAWIGSAVGVRAWALGVNQFGQSGSIADLYSAYRIDTANIVATCRAAVRA